MGIDKRYITLNIIISFILLTIVSSCSQTDSLNEVNYSTSSITITRSSQTEIYSATITNTLSFQATERRIETETPIQSSSAIIQPQLQDWKELPVIPDSISQRAMDIFEIGRKLQNNPYSFSVVGDCESSASWFLGDFDLDKSHYDLGVYDNLLTVINAFHGSFSRKSYAVGNGYNSASILSPFWADPEVCNPGETPLNCEIRLHHPSFVFVLLGTNDIYKINSFESNMRVIIESLIDKGIIPVLATKADNLEGDNKINEIITQLAFEYDIPLWNFWKVVQDLPNHGLQNDNAHLTWAGNDFSDPSAMEKAWPWRNLTALQVLDLLLKSVN